jgi:class 3 adenylate cyclase
VPQDPNDTGATIVHGTIVSVDMVGYSSIARVLEENIDSTTVAHLNRQLRQFIDSALDSVSVNWEQAAIAGTGDGAILRFESAVQVHNFACSLHVKTLAYNETRTDKSAQRWFRVGAASGAVNRFRGSSGRYEFAGVTIANAVRLEGAADPGELLVDRLTYDSLPGDLRGFYQPEETVAGKRDEKFKARRYRVLDVAPINAGAIIDHEAPRERRFVAVEK